MVPVRHGSSRLWAGYHLPTASTDSLPLLVCHGGPGVPSDYLFPLIGSLNRPVMFFDQLGCGRSDRPSPEVQEYSIAASAQDLVEVIEALLAKEWIPMRDGHPAYHLYGQSFGGILAAAPGLVESLGAAIKLRLAERAQVIAGLGRAAPEVPDIFTKIREYFAV